MKKARTVYLKVKDHGLAGATAVFRACLKVLVILFASSLSSTPAAANQLRGIYKNNQGVRRFQAKKAVEAFDRFNNAIADLPFTPEVHYNMGTTFLENKEYEKALSEYQIALKLAAGLKGPDGGAPEGAAKSRQADVSFRAHFNAAIALTELKKNDEALAHYQAALEILPQSVEVKTNIELLAQQDSGGGQGDDKDDKKDQKDQKDKKDKNDKKDNKDQKDKDDQNKDKPKPDPKDKNEPKAKPTPRPFKSQELNQQDVGRILEELKRQEDEIRSKMQRDGAKDAPRDKDW
jgi:Ca-activated chloride channel family protein